MGNSTESSINEYEQEEKRATLFYYQTYRYIPPVPNYSTPLFPYKNRKKDCGISPNFKSFFSHKSDFRSKKDEDKVLYEPLFKNIFNGTFVELGAFNGKEGSNSHFFELCLGWSGLLIEGNPLIYHDLVYNRPGAHKMNFAPSCNVSKSIDLYLYPSSDTDSIGYMKDYEQYPNVKVPCGPLGPMLEYVFQGQPITFFSLDVKGSELSVLETIDFNKVFIEVLMIELQNNFCRNLVRAKMKEVGYELFSHIIEKSDVYIHSKSLLLKSE